MCVSNRLFLVGMAHVEVDVAATGDVEGHFGVAHELTRRATQTDDDDY